MCIIVIIVFLFGSSILGQLFFLCVFSTFYFDDLHQSLFMDSYLYNMLCRCVVGKVFHVSYAYVYIYTHDMHILRYLIRRFHSILLVNWLVVSSRPPETNPRKSL